MSNRDATHQGLIEQALLDFATNTKDQSTSTASEIARSAARRLMAQIFVGEAFDSTPLPGRTFYDDLINDILQATTSAVPREELLSMVLDRLYSAQEYRAANVVLLLSGKQTSDKQGPEIVVEKIIGIHPSRLSNFVQQNSERLRSSGLVQSLLFNNQPMEFALLEAQRGTLYRGEFDHLISHRKSEETWISSIPLPSIDKNKPDKCLITLYAAKEQSGRLLLPRGASREWHVLEILQLAYSLLNHQLESVAEQVIAQRREILADLAPGIVNHEMNTQLTVFSEQISEIIKVGHLLREKLGKTNKEIRRLGHSLVLLRSARDKMSGIADAFNNLETRDANAAIQIKDIIDEINILLEYRLSNIGINMVFESTPKQITIKTDAALLEHVLINILVNALDAIKEQLELETAAEKSKAQRRKKKKKADKNISIYCEEKGDAVLIRLSNDGPPISNELKERIFEKGITTKPRGIGHGHGLFICRLIASFLGGTISFTDESSLATGMTVGFDLILPKDSGRTEDLLSSAGGT